MMYFMKRLLCLLGFHSWYENPDVVKGYGNQPIKVRGCKRKNCEATQFKDGNNNWQNSTKEKWLEFMHGATRIL
jgi:hypothetical protein